MELLLFFGVMVVLIVLLAVMKRPMVSDGKGGLIPKSRYERNQFEKYQADRFLGAVGDGNSSGGHRGMSNAGNPDHLWAEKDLVRNIRAGNLADAQTNWENIEKRYDSDDWKIAVWSVSFDEAHPHPENDFFWDGK